ncbi:MAG: hypothetical protein M0Q38_10375 [Bacteroidales bacterium]|jgi:hypothetical protein|nr:hypothetical protein [Bacteroidales bacterium]
MNDNEIHSDWIDRYHENELSPSELSRFNEIKRQSRILRAEVSVDRCLNDILADPDSLEFFRKVKTITQQRKSHTRFDPLLLAAASVLFLVTIGLILYLLFKDNPGWIDSKNKITMLRKTNHSGPFTFFQPNPADSIGKVAPAARGELVFHLRLEPDFKSLPELELLVGANTRTTTFKLIAPMTRQQIPAGSVINFTWDNEDNTQPVIISILNNRGKNIFETPGIQGNSYLLDTDDFQKGLFYWRITMEDELIMVGKIILF